MSLLPYAQTERQAEIIQAVEKHGGKRAAARALGVAEVTVRNSIKRAELAAARQGYSPPHDMTRTVPDGFRVKGVSTYYGADGKPAAQWVKSQIDHERQEELMREAVQALCESVKPVKPVKAPKEGLEHLLSVYPVGDHHVGMYAWHEDAGGDYDTDKAQALLSGAMDYLVDSAPHSETAVVALLGDFLHYDSFESVTPKSRNQLDSDTRYPLVVRVGARTVRYAIEKALRKHKRVHVIVAGGNHDPTSMVWLREMLATLYEKEPRVAVDRSPALFHYHRFGKVLIGVHHGDKVQKYENLAMLMAADRAKDWGETTHRYFYTGHIHQDRAKDLAGVSVESFQILAPADAWAQGQGYRPMQSMKRIDYHAEYGEVARAKVTPEMLDV